MGSSIEGVSPMAKKKPNKTAKKLKKGKHLSGTKSPAIIAVLIGKQ